MKRFIITMLAIALNITATVAPVLSLAAGTTPSRLELGYSPGYPASISIGGNTITVDGIPGTADYQSIWLTLVSSADGSQAYDWIESRNADERASFQVSVPNGHYYIELYHASENCTTYSSVIHGYDVQVAWRGGSGTFVESPVYAHNLVVSNSKRQDIAALMYYLEPSPSIQSNDQSIQRLAENITWGIAGGYGKAVAIHDWVCENIYYNYDAYHGRSSYGDTTAAGVLNSGMSVCEGYANLTAALLRAAGIPAKKVSGYALGLSTSGKWTAGYVPGTEVNHTWNEAYVDGRWVIIDTTWDSGNDYEFGGYTNSDGLRGYHYFL